MARPPGPKQRRYRGVVRAQIESVRRHIDNLLGWDEKWRGNPIDHYPTQLANAADMAQISATFALMNLWLSDEGPIPTRP